MAPTSCLLNSYSYHGTTASNLQGTPGSIEAREIIRKRHDSSSGLHVKDISKANASKVGASRTFFLKPKMILHQNKNNSSMISDLGLGRMVDRFVYRQNLYISSYEVGADRRASVETLMNNLQETSINHVKEIGVWGDGLGLTKEMCKRNLIWVMARLQVKMVQYPVWGDVVQIDTWMGAYGKIGMTSDWMLRNCETGEILVTASCVWLMMNKETRKLSKFPIEVRGELDPHFTDTPPAVEEDTRKWSKRDENIVDHVRNGLMPRWSDLDINQHVNNVKYIGWILESVPNTILEKYELASMTLEYHQECRMDNVLQSHTYVIDQYNNDQEDHVDCEHLLRFEIGGGGGGGEIMKGRTIWRSKDRNTTGGDGSGPAINTIK